jgi:hypothetical protein
VSSAPLALWYQQFSGGVNIKLNLGCGFKKKPGFTNVDRGDFCSPDQIVNLVSGAWPWENNSIDEAVFEFSLEQMGETSEQLMHVMTELFRVCQNEAKITVIVLHPRHDRFVLNPLCRQRISLEFFHMMNVQNNLNQISAGLSDNCLGLQYGVNFTVAGFKFLLTEETHQKISSGELTEPEIRLKMHHENNICEALEIHLQVLKLE